MIPEVSQNIRIYNIAIVVLFEKSMTAVLFQFVFLLTLLLFLESTSLLGDRSFLKHYKYNESD